MELFELSKPGFAQDEGGWRGVAPSDDKSPDMPVERLPLLPLVMQYSRNY